MKFECKLLQDPQQVPPTAECDRCGRDIYGESEDDGFGAILCSECKEKLEISEHDAELIQEVMEGFDSALTLYLSEHLRNKVWNKVCEKYPQIRDGA